MEGIALKSPGDNPFNNSIHRFFICINIKNLYLALSTTAYKICADLHAFSLKNSPQALHILSTECF